MGSRERERLRLGLGEGLQGRLHERSGDILDPQEEKMKEPSPEGSCMSKGLEGRQLRYLQRLFRTQAGFAGVYVLREKGSISISLGDMGILIISILRALRRRFS